MILQAGGRRLDLAQPRVMGILNLTPDSFSDGGRWMRGDLPDVGYIREVAEQMLADGAAIIDIGGESTRPGATPITIQEELRRVMPVLHQLIELDTILSIDTRKPEVAECALAAGVHLLNDVSGLQVPGMLDVLAATNAAACIMHMQGLPHTMQQAPRYGDVVTEVRSFFSQQVAACEVIGISTDRLILDPGFGFGKSLIHNVTLLKNLGNLTVKNLPLLVGVSRKGMIGEITGREVNERLPGSIGAALAGIAQGARIIRVHDVGPMVDALKTFTMGSAHSSVKAD